MGPERGAPHFFPPLCGETAARGKHRQAVIHDVDHGSNE